MEKKDSRMWIKATGVVFTVASIVLGSWFIDDRYALSQALRDAETDIAANFNKLGKRLDRKIKEDEVQYLKRRLWRLQDRTNSVSCGKFKDTCREIKEDIKKKRDKK